MTDDAYVCMRDAVNIARQFQIKSVSALRDRLMTKGYQPEVVKEALQTWANYEKSKSER